MRLLYGTTNQAKLTAMQNRLRPLGIELISLLDMEKAPPVIEETGASPLENARIKAKAYYDFYQIPVFSLDSGLYFENIEKKDQPGIRVRTIGGRYLTDEEMVEYYVQLVKKYGTLTGYYKNGICLYLEGGQAVERMDQTTESERFWLTEDVRPIQQKGFPMDSMSVDPKTGKHFYDMGQSKIDNVAIQEGIVDFFKGVK